MEIKYGCYGGIRVDRTEVIMFLRVLFTALSCSAPFLLVSDNVPSWMNLAAWIYIILMIAFGLMALKAREIIAWCDKQLGDKDDENAR
ncbi:MULTISPECIES: hypothetical protein [Vibrio]|uniref:hypothetical protein n=1 Tax=Vibrio TaxID=662 RepID=UPI001CDCA14C|nr:MULTISPECIES: hypothetical protein [Vibrio]MDF5387929.1 hypothetical protein [Vibrio parahaemolyticus]MDF5528058.1 hypothetical protein [Vibrio parahaemolyticus]MDF5565302.1 hypothetical protein [Vibrio parahaemolyticus]MDW2143572.1 hypothetical protein [Vibrio sp. 1833]MDW3059245.1 hypothetical protein [Vibrio sp. 1978]